MRTRFLNNDYFTSPPSQRRETLPFLHLPVPRLPWPSSSAVHNHLHFPFPLHVSLHIDPLPIDAALSTFLSGVLPHRILIDSQYFTTPSPNGDCQSSFIAGSVDNPNREQEADIIFDGHASEADTEFSKESKTTALSDEKDVISESIQFQTPELDAHLENACFFEMERMQILCQTPEIENCLEMLKPEPSRQYPYEALVSVSSVEDFFLENLAGENEYSLEDNISFQHPPRSDQNKFLILEVEEESLGIPMCLSVVEIVGSNFENIRPQNFDEWYQSVTEGKELLNSKNDNMMQIFSDDCISKESLVLSDLFPERDFMNMLETEHVDGNSALQGTLLAGSAFLMNVVTFQEFVFLEEDLIQTFESFYKTKALDDLETNDWMFKKDYNFKSFDELIVSNEIALTDDMFKSLPVPVMHDCVKMITLHDIIGELFSNLKTRPLSVSDGIYLNWDLLEEAKCNCKMSNWYQDILAKINLNDQDFGGKYFKDGTLVFDLLSFGDSVDEREELHKLLSDCMSPLDDQPVEFALSILLEDESSKQGSREQLPERNADTASLLFKSMSNINNCKSLVDNQPVEFASSKPLEQGSSKQGSQEQLPEINAERASLLFKSMSEISNLDYFLNPQKATIKGNCNFAVESTNANASIPKVTSSELKAGQESQEWHTVLHKVKLSDNIVALAGYFEKSYLAILESETELTKTRSDVDYFKLLSLQKHKLIEYNVNENNMAFIVLSAIKQTAWYLCFYGLRPACLYVDKLCQNSEYLKSRLGFLQSLIRNEHRKADNNVTTVHPSLTIVKEILKSNIKQDKVKALIVAEEVFWCSLKTLLLSMGLSFNELNNTYRNQSYTSDVPEDTITQMKELLISDCLLVSFEHVSPLFPFNKFSIILECGGPYGSSRISELSPKSVGLPHLHFLMVELDGHAALKAICEGVEIPSNTEMLMESETHLVFNQKESMMNQKLARLLNFCLVEQRYDMKSSKVAFEVDNSVPIVLDVKIEHGHQCMEPFLGTVIIVNTQTVDKEMIVSRRNSYQMILALEKEGIQVVERDFELPVDIILSSAICLAWYDCRNLGKKATPATEASSSLPLCIENIATDVLTLLSFYFRGCFLVFEGEINFLSTVMESSDGLYAAAASLGIDLQIFLCYSAELTNQVMVSCIKSATNLTRGLYPKMPDSVTLGESFLMEFPGINPLTALSILSSGAMVNDFLEMSHEQRLRVLEKYHVPEESISLFSVFCKYGEREDSKSIMTDCSSSVSSGPDSARCGLYQVENERKRKNAMSSHQKDEVSFDELLQFETLNQVVDVVPDYPTLPKPFDLGMSKDAGRSCDTAKVSFPTSDFFGQNQRISTTPMRNLSRVSQTPLNCKAPQISEQLRQSSLSLKNEDLAQNEILDTPLMGKFSNWHSIGNSEKLHEDVIGEVVDFTDSPLLGKSFSVSDPMYFSSLMTETEEDQIRKKKVARRMTFDQPDTNSSKTWRRSSRDTQGQVDDFPEPDFGKDVFPLDFRPPENIGFTRAPLRNSQGPPFQEEMSHLSETPLSRARQSSSLLKNSPWTIEFINKVKERSKLRQKSFSCENPGPYFGYPGNMSKVSKQRSPSIIEYFKYQPNGLTGKFPEQKRQKNSGQSSNSFKKGRYSAPRSSWTPNDKRSTKTLTYGRDKNGGQTKLVWSDK